MGQPDRVKSMLCRLAAVASLAAWTGGCGYDTVFHSWFDHGAGRDASGAKLAGHVYLLRGVAGDIFSLGMDQLADKINHRGVTANVYGLSDYNTLADEIIRKYSAGEDRGPIVLIGHSTGGDLVITISEKLQAAGVPVALAFGFDPTRIADHVPANVEVFINLYQPYNPIGGGEAKAGPDFRGRLINVDLHEHSEIVHITLDKNPAIHDAVTEKIVALAAYAARGAQQPDAKHRGGSAEARPLVLKYTVPHDAPIILWDSAIEVKAKPGETLETIASAYGGPAWAIAQINKLEPGRPIEPGRALLIPRSQYNSDMSPSAAAPPTAQRGRGRPVARVSATKPTAQDQSPAGAAPAVARNKNSFSDRFETAQ